MTRHARQSGLVVAVIGPDAAGKTAIVAGLTHALSGQCPVTSMHLGSPPWTLASGSVVLACLVLYRLARMDPRSSPRVAAAAVYLHGLALALARGAAARRAHKLATKGHLVIADRYPGRQPGSAAGPSTAYRPTSRMGHVLADFERSLYRRMPPPDLVVRVRVPLDVCLARNASRVRPKDVAAVTTSQSASELVRFEGVSELEADNTLPLIIVLPGLVAPIAARLSLRELA